MLYNKISNKVNKFPSIASYIERDYPTLYNIMENVGVLQYLTPRKQGKTFLLPDNSYIKKMETKVFSDPEAVTDMILSIIVDDYLPNIESWERKKSDIPNLLRKKIIPKDFEGKKIVLSNGATLTKDEKYQPLTRQGKYVRDNTSVWLLKGEVDYSDNIPIATYENLNKKMPKKGSGEGDTETGRRKLALDVSKKFVDFLKGTTDVDPYLTVMANIINYSKGDLKLEGLVKIALADCAIHIGFYNLFEPYSKTSKPLLSDFDISKFMQSHNNGFLPADDPVKTITSFYESLMPGSDSVFGMKEKQLNFLRTREKVRDEIMADAGMTNTVKNINEIYSKLEKTNSIKDIKNIYPKEAFQLVVTEKGRLGAIQENAFAFESKFLNLIKQKNSQYEEPIREFTDLISCITSKQNMPYTDQFSFGKIENIKALHGGMPFFAAGAGTYIRSSSFLSIPDTNIKSGAGKFDEDSLHPLSSDYVNLTGRNLGMLRKLKSPRFELSKSTLNELKMYKKYRGKMPRV